MVEFRDVSVSYGPLKAVDGVDLTVPDGRTYALIGPSGCGKSTLLRCVVGLVWPTSGSVRVQGEPVTRERVVTLRRKLGYVIQDGGLFPHLTARANVEAMPRHLGWDGTKTRERTRELAETVHLAEDALDRYPAELSGGQRQRVALMRALALDPPVLLLDEPLAALDPMVRNSLQTELKEVCDRLKKTVVLVTHDMAEAAYLAETIVLVREGRIVQQGSLDELRSRPAVPFVEEFIAAQRSLVAL
ncbi:MAG: ABC transporter ATP-binding protein [Fimbriimonadaceae bacterium]|nr:ABC transporter ATP-binding protein [Fimbriimonadaceae bacterium]QYK56833.1 MAG: ABC transporter ATP-binding protein [Fimbriimonadaceae bacterium]